MKDKAKNNPNPVVRAAIYARVSTNEQAEGNYASCESQTEEMERFCQQKDWRIEASITDAGYRAELSIVPD